MNLFDAFRAPSWITFQLLERCNLRCRMCYEWGDTGAYHADAKPAALELQLVLSTVDECLPYRPRFEFFGGEPLLYPAIFDVIERITGGGCEVAFPTNGTLLEAHADRLVRSAPQRVWVSLDGPEEVNDRQRGAGVFARAMRGIEAVDRAKRRHGSRRPDLGVTYVVTPENFRHVEGFFREAVDLSLLAAISIECQSFATAAEARDYATMARARFGAAHTPCANAYVRDPSVFAGIDFESLASQMQSVGRMSAERGIAFHSQPRGLTARNLRHYFAGERREMTDWKPRCGVPWVAAEVSARGEVTTCHSFYDISLGNLHDAGLLEIWRGARAEAMRAELRDGLLPICAACCRYYGGAGAFAREGMRDG
jgi:MoaA/NifB/PqqE/SkfB family radical SAM enzyme